MKKYLAALLILAATFTVSVIPVFATTIQCASNNIIPPDGDADVFGTAGMPKQAHSFTVSQECTITSVGVYALKDAARSANDGYMEVWSDSAGAPSASLATGSTLTLASGSNLAWATSTFSGANQITLHTSTTYWLVDNASSTAVNALRQGESGSGTGLGFCGGIWTNACLGLPNAQATFNLYGTAPVIATVPTQPLSRAFWWGL